MSRSSWAIAMALVFLAPTVIGGNARSDEVTRVIFDEQGRIAEEHGSVPGTDIAFARHYWYADHAAKPPGTPGKGPGGGGDGGSDPGTDCEADQFKTTGWHWTGAYRGYASAYAAEFNAAGVAWDDASSADLFAGFTAGKAGDAGEFDGVNQVEFVSLGASSTIAVTTTWYYRSTNEAVESDGQYNTYYDWATDGRAGAMDVLNIAVHEVGHTYGLDHPKGPEHKIGCLSMYAYASNGETQKRSLGDGDVLGIESIYGA